MPDKPRKDPPDSRHASKIRMERALMDISGKSRGEVRQAIRSRDVNNLLLGASVPLPQKNVPQKLATPEVKSTTESFQPKSFSVAGQATGSSSGQAASISYISVEVTGNLNGSLATGIAMFETRPEPV